MLERKSILNQIGNSGWHIRVRSEPESIPNVVNISSVYRVTVRMIQHILLNQLKQSTQADCNMAWWISVPKCSGTVWHSHMPYDSLIIGSQMWLKTTWPSSSDSWTALLALLWLWNIRQVLLPLTKEALTLKLKESSKFLMNHQFESQKSWPICPLLERRPRGGRGLRINGNGNPFKNIETHVDAEKGGE